MTARDVAALWDGEAATFDDEPDHGLGDPAVREAWRTLLAEHLPAPPARVADLGCGTGSLSVLLAEQGHRVSGIDLSPQMVQRARAKAESRGLDVEVTVGDVADPGLPAATFDVVLSRHVLWAVPDPAAALERWVDLLAPGGRLVLVEGFWFTEAGLRARDAEALVRALDRQATVHPLDDPRLWGKQVADERYLLVSTG